MERAAPELIVAVKNVLDTFLDSGERAAQQLALSDLYTVLRVFGGRDKLSEAVLSFKASSFGSQKVALSPLRKAVEAEQLIAVAEAALPAETPLAAIEEASAPVTEPYLYILMRNDLASMNAGKAVAQGSHAANQMIFEAMIATDPLARILVRDKAYALEALVREWTSAARGFGTCIVLGVNEDQMRSTVAAAQENNLHAGITHDPSYPVRDGQTFYTLPLDTCAYVFGRKCDVSPFVKEFNLMP